VVSAPRVERVKHFAADMHVDPGHLSTDGPQWHFAADV
jgi:hypothetical protein